MFATTNFGDIDGSCVNSTSHQSPCYGAYAGSEWITQAEKDILEIRIQKMIWGNEG
jgi:hypothetical protein